MRRLFLRLSVCTAFALILAGCDSGTGTSAVPAPGGAAANNAPPPAAPAGPATKGKSAPSTTTPTGTQLVP
jgi:hypothetical protein